MRAPCRERAQRSLIVRSSHLVGLKNRSARLQRLHSGGVRDRTELAQVSKSYPCPATANISSPAAIQTTTPGARSSAAVRASNPWRSESAWIRLIAMRGAAVSFKSIDGAVSVFSGSRGGGVAYWLDSPGSGDPGHSRARRSNRATIGRG